MQQIQDKAEARIKALESTAKDLWANIREKKSRRTEYVMNRYAFFVASRHKGLTTVSLAEISGFDHATIVHATKCHEANLLLEVYKKYYALYLEAMTNSKEILEIIDLEKELEKTIHFADEIRRRLKSYGKPQFLTNKSLY